MSILYNYIAVIERIEGVENIVKQNQWDAYKEQGTLLNVTNFYSNFMFIYTTISCLGEVLSVGARFCCIYPTPSKGRVACFARKTQEYRIP